MKQSQNALLAALALIMTVGFSSAQAADRDHGHGAVGSIVSNPGRRVDRPGDNLRYGSHLSQNAELIVRKMYRGILFREPDPQGFRNAVYQIQSQGEIGLANLAMSIGDSAEFFQNIEPRYRNLDIVLNMYRELLNREGDQGGIQFWVNVLDRRLPGEALKGFVTSEEFRRLYVY